MLCVAKDISGKQQFMNILDIIYSERKLSEFMNILPLLHQG